MANEQNLIPNNRRSKEEVRKNASKGGKKSGEVRRKKRQIKDCMNLLLELPVTSTKDFNKLSRMGIPVEEIDNKMMLVVALFNRAVTLGDVAAVKEIRNIIGDDAASQDVIDKLDDVLKKIKGDV